ncbi:MAG TPA: transcriptional repressor [Vicinamibacteria bacterium]|nr:transcriptional repressor [Vicinamibacteria bacterium]
MLGHHSRQREVILGVVRSTMDHPTADWVYRQARRQLPQISLGTVYRNLKRLAADGLIGEIHTADGLQARFDGNTGRHYHIRCVACGRVHDLPVSVDSRLEEEAGRAMNYRILGHHVEVQGVCPACQAAAGSSDNDSHLDVREEEE